MNLMPLFKKKKERELYSHTTHVDVGDGCIFCTFHVYGDHIITNAKLHHHE